jgi:hypothetical protein
MTGEISIGGVYLPSILLLAVAAVILYTPPIEISPGPIAR